MAIRYHCIECEQVHGAGECEGRKPAAKAKPPPASKIAKATPAPVADRETGGVVSTPLHPPKPSQKIFSDAKVDADAPTEIKYAPEMTKALTGVGGPAGWVRVCEGCGREVPGTARRRYCSAYCKVRVWREKRRRLKS